MAKILIVVDMQNDFIDGALGTKEAVTIVPYVKEVIEQFEGKVYFTRDTHFENYMETQEGKNLPVVHCIQGTKGWEIHPELEKLRKTDAIDKVTFGSKDLAEILKQEGNIEEITFVGLCTDIFPDVLCSVIIILYYNVTVYTCRKRLYCSLIF